MYRKLLTIFALIFFNLITIGLTSKEGQAEPKKKILLGSPVCQKSAILEQFLASLNRLKKESFTLDYYFVDDNDDQLSSQLLQTFSNGEGNNCHIEKSMKSANDPKYVCDEHTHLWKDELVWKVAAFKDKMFEYALENDYDYIFLIDSDIVLHPRTIEQLLVGNKDILCNIFWTSWTPNTIEKPQVWISDHYTQHRTKPGEVLTPGQVLLREMEFFAELRKPGIYEVGGLGACTLISKHAMQKGVSFKKISNLSLWGEDRHFCVRAAAIGLGLFVDTHYPAYHIYRESSLSGVEPFIRSCEESPEVKKTPKIILSMIMKNEADRYLRPCLENAKRYITEAVIIDDGSTDNSAEVCLEALDGIPVHLIRNNISKFTNEVSLRKQQWEETIKRNPDWILCIDADEIFEDRFADGVKKLVSNTKADALYFRLYDFWDMNHYRDDEYWKAHHYYRPFLIRYKPNIDYHWKETPQHCGRFPLNINDFKRQYSPLRLKHYGWAKAKDRIEKYERYQKLDPGAQYGWKEQYDSILDENPHLLLWVENE